MGMGEKDKINGGGVETERFGILLGELAPPLEQAAIDQDPLPGAFYKVAGTGDVVVRAVK
jgi:hypothetical protein